MFEFNAQGYIDFIQDNFTIVDKDKNEVPFVPNKAQIHFLQNIEERNIILKARKMGFCLDPNTKILTSKLQWKRIDDVRVGDELVGVDEDAPEGRGMMRSMRRSVVEAKREIHEEAFKITFANGQTITATGQHRFLYRNQITKSHWREVDKMKVGGKIRYITEPWGEPNMEDAWFSGILDGEACLRSKSSGGTEMTIAQNIGPVWDRIQTYAENSGLAYRIDDDTRAARTKPHKRLVFARTNELLALVGKTQSTRFLNSDWWVDRCMPGKRSGLAWQEIVSIEPVGVQRMIDLQTSTKTFIAEGFISHNSSILLAVACAKFLMGKNERCVSMSFDKEASSKQLERAKHFIKSYERKNKVQIPLKYNSKSELVWEGKNPDGTTFNNSLRIGTAKSTGFGRGDDITFLHLTEVSLADHLDELLAGVGEAVVKNTVVSLETTANGYNEFKTLWDEAVAGARDYNALFYDPTWEYSMEYIEKKRKHLGRLADQEYPMTPEAAFIASGNQYFDRLALQELLAKTEKQKTIGGFRKYRDFEQGEFVICFADTAAGGGDFCAAHFLSKNRLDIPLVYHSKVIATEMTPLIHEKLNEIYEQTGVKPVVAYERNNGGFFEMDRLSKLNRNQNYTIYRAKRNQGTKFKDSDGPKLGWDTNSATRPVMLTMLKDCIDNQLIRIYDNPTITEMFSFIEVQTSTQWRAQAEKNAHDDLVMALAGAWQLYQTEKPVNFTRNVIKKKKSYDPVTGRLLS